MTGTALTGSSSTPFVSFRACSEDRRVLAVLGMQFRSFGVIVSGVLTVSVSQVGVVRSLLVFTGLVAFCCLSGVISRPLR